MYECVQMGTLEYCIRIKQTYSSVLLTESLLSFNYILLFTGKQQQVQLSFPPYSEDQEIIDGRQVHPSNWLPPYSTHQLSGHALNVPHSGMKPPAPVFMGSTLLEQQQSTQQQYQQPQWSSICPTVPGSRPLTHAVTLQPHYETMVPTAHVAAIGANNHLQSESTPYSA